MQDSGEKPQPPPLKERLRQVLENQGLSGLVHTLEARGFEPERVKAYLSNPKKSLKFGPPSEADIHTWLPRMLERKEREYSNWRTSLEIEQARVHHDDSVVKRYTEYMEKAKREYEEYKKILENFKAGDSRPLLTKLSRLKDEELNNLVYFLDQLPSPNSVSWEKRYSINPKVDYKSGSLDSRYMNNALNFLNNATDYMTLLRLSRQVAGPPSSPAAPTAKA